MDRLRQRPASGFTLIEVLVVLVIFGIALGLVAVRLLPDDAQLARQEGERTALLLERAADEAESTGKPLAWFPQDNSASFQIPDGQGGWQALEGDEAFTPHVLPGALRWSTLQFGQEQAGAVPGGLRAQPGKTPLRLVFLPGEAATLFAISLGTPTAHVVLRGDIQGRVRVEASP